jgi:hypothetical protein
MLSPDPHTRMALVADYHAELRHRAATANATRAASRARLFESRRLRPYRRLALVRGVVRAA